MRKFATVLVALGAMSGVALTSVGSTTPGAAAATQASGWQVQDQFNPAPGNFSPTAAVCPSPSSCVAVGLVGSTSSSGASGQMGALYSTDGGQDWSLGRLPSVAGGLWEAVGQLACGTPEDCVTIAASGQALLTTNGGVAWTAGGTVPAYSPSAPNMLSCGSADNCVLSDASGFAFTADGGASWTNTLLPSWLGAVTAGPTCPSASFCMVAGMEPNNGSYTPTLAVTTDGGQSWTQLTSPDPASSLDSVACSAPDQCLGADVGGQWSSTDEGSTWQPIADPIAMADQTLNCASSGICSAFNVGTGTGPVTVEITDNLGQSWSESTVSDSPTFSNDLLSQADQIGALSCPSSSDCVAVLNAMTSGATSWLAVSSNTLIYWNLANLPVITPPLDAVSCPTPSDCVATEGDIFGSGVSSPTTVRTTDGGTYWTVVNTTASLSALSCPSTTECFAVGAPAANTSSGIFVTIDGGQTWTEADITDATDPDGEVPNGSTVGSSGNAIACPSTADCVAVVLGVVYVTGDGGATWTSPSYPGEQGHAESVACSSDSTCVLADQAGFVFTTDGGQTWSAASQPFDNNDFGDAASMSCSGTLCVAVGGFGPSSGAYMDLVSNDSGQTWTAENPYDPTTGDALVSVSCTTSSYCAAAGLPDGGALYGGAVLLSSSDGGINWTPQSATSADLLDAVSCASPGACEAVGMNANNDSGIILGATSGTGTVTVTINADGGTGTGTVVSDPPGIDCPGTCSATFTNGTPVTLTATPGSTSVMAEPAALIGCDGAAAPTSPDSGTCDVVAGNQPVDQVDVEFTQMESSFSTQPAASGQNGGSAVLTDFDGCNSIGATTYIWTVDGSVLPATGCQASDSLSVGDHAVGLTIADPSGTRTVTTSRTIDVQPVVGFSYSIPPVALGSATATVLLDACTRSGGVTGFAWTLAVGAVQPEPGCEESFTGPVRSAVNIVLRRVVEH